jgi:hypothetical protein
MAVNPENNMKHMNKMIGQNFVITVLLKRVNRQQYVHIQEVGWQLDRRLRGWNEPENSTNVYQEVLWYEQTGAIISRMR